MEVISRHPETMAQPDPACATRTPAFSSAAPQKAPRLLGILAISAIFFAGITHAQSIWITDFNNDSTQPPQGYRYDTGIWGEDALINFAYDVVGITLDIQVSINGGPYTSGFSSSSDDSSGTGSVYFTLPYTCGKLTVVVRRYYMQGTRAYSVYTSPTEIFAYQGNNLQCLPRRDYCSRESGGQAVGKPCDVVDGTLWYTSNDLALSGPFGLKFTRWYNNQSTSLFNTDLGAGWRHSYSANLTFPAPGQITYYSPEGLRTDFNGLSPGGSTHDMISGADLSLDSTGTVYTLTTWNGVKYTFDSSGRLSSVTDRIGNTQTITRDASNRISTVTDPLGRKLTFSYDSSNRISSITSSPAGLSLTFTYDSPCGTGNLCSATMPDGKTWQYQYDVARNLTRVTDPLGYAEEINTYDGSGRLVTQTTDGGQNSLTFAYGTNTTTVTDGLGRQTIYTFDPRLRVVTDIQGIGCGCGGGERRSFTYDQFLRKRTEMIGNDTNHQITWTYGRDQTVNHGSFIEIVMPYPSPTAKTEHLSPGIDRTISWSYYPLSDPRRDLVQVETMPSVDCPGNNRTTTFTYTTNGLLTSRTEQGYVSCTNTIYTTSFTYDSNGRGRIATVTDPRGNVTTYSYYSDTDTDLARRGQLMTVTDAAGNVTTYAGAASPNNTYDLFGNPLSITDPNGVTTIMAYDARGRITSRTLKGVPGDPTDLVTTYQYDDAGKLTKITLPRGNATSYRYDSSNRLTDTIRLDTDGTEVERIHLVYDAMSQKIEEDNDACTNPATICTTWSTKRKDTFTYDAYGRLATITHPDGSTVVYQYDNYGNLASVKDERHTSANTLYSYDFANRLVSVTQKRTIVPGSDVVTTYAYDLHDNLISVTDPNGNQTTYTWDDFRRMKSQVSPVSGTTTYQYDQAGNLVSSTDANGATTTRTYDALNRLTSASSQRPNYTTETVTYVYDDPNGSHFGRGRLAKMIDPSGSTLFKYERRGLVRLEEKIIGTTRYVTSTIYDANGNRASITTPSGRVVNFTYDAADRPITENGATTTYVSGAAYQPFGPISSIALGNGTTWSETFNQRYLPTALTMSGTTESVSYTYATDAAGNITAIIDSTPGYSRTSLAYDDVNRLITANTGSSLWGTGNFEYDAMGNITSMTLGTTTRTFTYLGSTPKLASVTEPAPIGTRSVSYDAAGNEITIGNDSYTYSPRNFLASGDGLSYLYDGRGLRTTETLSGLRITSVLDATTMQPNTPVRPLGGTTVLTLLINGSGFTTSSQASFNGVAKPTTFISANQLQMEITYNDLTTANIAIVSVTDPASPPASAPFVVYFLDVPPTYWAYNFVNLLVYHGITNGCGNGYYCPAAPVTRAQMAVFLLKAEHGPGWSPPNCVTQVFDDVPCTHWAAKWINQLAANQFTAGANVAWGLFCPQIVR